MTARANSRRRAFALLAGLTAAFAASPTFAACRNLTFEGSAYTACNFDPAAKTLRLFSLDKTGEPYRYFQPLADALQAEGQRLTFAMNAGMFDDNQRPIGLYIEGGKQMKKLNRRNGGGNFHLKPNGVFYIAGSKAGVLETEAYAKSGLKPDYATQSGPMLVINGKLHPKFSDGGTSRKIRNGVGIDDQGHVQLVISDNPVTFHEFARLFRDELRSSNALFLDGTISSLYAPELGRVDGFLPLGPMVGAAESE